ncbi:Oxidase ustYa [Lachnellula suecica]|uniref:Oxidase ustYa n=1 Tax=Lachnellula suecica TaxID=602035 RepID=A0A8T9CF78_9HELO|nr:Oxidase ustYa [Lachnellula suecica]
MSQMFLLTIVALMAGAFGFFATREAFNILSAPLGFHCKSPRQPQIELRQQLTIFSVETATHTFHYNRSFSYPPSNHTNRAWRSIFPKKGGFFVHPTIAPTRSTFSVFHQLHCLNGIRTAYWVSHEAAIRGQRLPDEEIPIDIQPSHIRHCIDLLRQVLMCHGDTTLEVVDEKINGVHGFRTPHQCVDWEQLRVWTSEQQAKHDVEQIV